jgi:hypothetical protein
MTNVDPQTTSEFWDAYVTAAASNDRMDASSAREPMPASCGGVPADSDC